MLIKTIRATFDGKTYIPEETAGVPIGTKVVFEVQMPPPADGNTQTQRVLDAIRGKMSREEAELRLKQLYERRQADVAAHQGDR